MVVCELTSGVSAQDEFSDLIVNKDEETVWERTEPPTGPVRERVGTKYRVRIFEWIGSWQDKRDGGKFKSAEIQDKETVFAIPYLKRYILWIEYT